MTYLTVPISADRPEKALSQAQAAKDAGAEMLELRSDYLVNLTRETVRELVTYLKSSPPPLPRIVAGRDKAEGGAHDYPLKHRTFQSGN